jgi:hypothetical protein
MLFSYWAFRAADHRAVHLATILVTLLLRYFLVLTRINEMWLFVEKGGETRRHDVDVSPAYQGLF